MKFEIENAGVELIRDAQLKAKMQLAERAKQLADAERSLAADTGAPSKRSYWDAVHQRLSASAQEHAAYKKETEAVKAAFNKQFKETGQFGKTDLKTESPTNNYHQARLGAALGAIEAIALLSMVADSKDRGWDIFTLEILSSACSLLSTTADMAYAFTKSVRELPKYTMIQGADTALDIRRGGFKLAAGGFAVAAGIFSIFNTLAKTEKEKDPTKLALLWARFAVDLGSTISGGLAAYSYTKPLFNHLAEKQGRSAIAKSFYGSLAKGADFFAKRVLLLRVVAWVSWAGVALTVIDISALLIRMYLDSQAVNYWFERCVFRKNRSKKPFANVKEELKELAKAQHPGNEVEQAEATIAHLPQPQS